MTDFEDYAELDRKAEQEAAERLWKTTREQAKIGPKGLHPDSSVDLETWRNTVLNYFRGVYSSHDMHILVWCRIYISIVSISADTILVHYSLENLYDGGLPLNFEDALFNPDGLNRQWLTEDLTTSESRKSTPWMTGVTGSIRKHEPDVFLAPELYASLTRIYVREEDGSWELEGFGKCIPGHTYNFQLLFGGLLSNVFTWTVPS